MTLAVRTVRALLPSVVVLCAVFFFINTACLGGGDDDPECSLAPDVRGENAIAIVEPAEGARLSTPGQNGAVEVQVRLSATGVVPAPRGVCDRRAGTFTVSATPDPPCQPGAVARVVQLSQGETETRLPLFPGSYQLRAEFKHNSGQPYPEPLIASVRITVAGDAASVGAPCP